MAHEEGIPPQSHADTQHLPLEEVDALTADQQRLAEGTAPLIQGHYAMAKHLAAQYGDEVVAGDEVTTAADLKILHRARREDRAALEYDATHDAPTGLYNKATFNKRLERVLAGENPHVALMMIDLDHLKLVNDQCGHETGDRLIEEIGATLNDLVRRSDMAARTGGDEFAVLLEDFDVSDAERSEEILRNFQDKIETGLQQTMEGVVRRKLGLAEGDPLPFSVGASLGYGVIDPKNPLSPSEFKEQVDGRMYQRKQERKGADIPENESV